MGDLKLKCTATISTVYWRSNEESVQGSGFNAQHNIASASQPISGESRGRTSGKYQLVLSLNYILKDEVFTIKANLLQKFLFFTNSISW